MAKDLVEEVAFAARDSEFVDSKSGVSARLSISSMENLIAAGKLRLIESELSNTNIRLIDFMSIIPSITGKIELVYEGEQEGADEVAKILIERAIIVKFEQIFPGIPKLEKEGIKTPYTNLIEWFNSNYIELNYSDIDIQYQKKLSSINPLIKLIEEYASQLNLEDQLFCMEMVLWALTVKNKLDMSDNKSTFKFESLNVANSYYGKQNL